MPGEVGQFTTLYNLLFFTKYTKYMSVQAEKPGHFLRW
jgi:hypothetical protein